MPVTSFLHPTTGEPVPFDQAAARFDADGVLPPEVTNLILEDINDPIRQGAHLSPSMLIPETTCRREVAIERLLAYPLDPLSIWDALEGTVMHSVLQSAGAPGRTYEKRLGGGEAAEVEVFPGILLSGKPDSVEEIDAASVAINDLKSSRFPWKKDREGKPRSFDHLNIGKWAIQLNLYRYLWEDLNAGRQVKSLWVWRYYRGSYDRTVTWRKIPIPLVARDVLWGKIGAFTLSLKGYLEEGMRIAQEGDLGKLEEFVASIPMDGEIQKMFNNRKCFDFCGVRDLCYKLEGRSAF